MYFKPSLKCNETCHWTIDANRQSVCSKPSIVMLHARKETHTNVLGVFNLTHFGANCGANSIPRNQTQVVKNQLT